MVPAYGDVTSVISIHAPREGGDCSAAALALCCVRFQSTPPARGATIIAIGPPKLSCISIHAPREGGDPLAVAQGFPPV